MLYTPLNYLQFVLHLGGLRKLGPNAMSSILTMSALIEKSVCRPDLIYNVLQNLFRLHQQNILVRLWIASHSGIMGNEVADHLPKEARGRGKLRAVFFIVSKNRFSLEDRANGDAEKSKSLPDLG